MLALAAHYHRRGQLDEAAALYRQAADGGVPAGLNDLAVLRGEQGSAR